jgi:Protein of unknown function (DUF1515)
MVDSIHDMSRAVGALEGTVKNMTDQWARQEAAASEGRRVVHEKLDEVKETQTRTTAELQQLKDEFAILKPAITAFQKKQDEAEGMKNLGKILWLGMGGIAAAVGYLVHEWLNFLKGPH